MPSRFLIFSYQEGDDVIALGQITCQRAALAVALARSDGCEFLDQLSVILDYLLWNGGPDVGNIGLWIGHGLDLAGRNHGRAASRRKWSRLIRDMPGAGSEFRPLSRC